MKIVLIIAVIALLVLALMVMFAKGVIRGEFHITIKPSDDFDGGMDVLPRLEVYDDIDTVSKKKWILIRVITKRE